MHPILFQMLFVFFKCYFSNAIYIFQILLKAFTPSPREAASHVAGASEVPARSGQPRTPRAVAGCCASTHAWTGASCQQ